MVNKYDINQIFQSLCKQYSINQIAKNLNVNIGTVKRWQELHNVPENYIFDLLKMANIKIDYSIFSYKDKDQFFTSESMARECVDITMSFLEEYIDISEYTFIEPSAGNGVFLKLLPQPRIGLDIEKFDDEIIIQDFLTYNPPPGKYITIGNPPFGLRGQKALQFIQHAFEFSDYVAFILPPLFNSDGRGTPKKRVGYNLVYHKDLTDNKFYYPDNKKVNVNAIFQIWSKEDIGINLNETIEPIGYKVYSLSNGGTPATTRNLDKLDKCDFYLPSTVYGIEKMRLYSSFEELPQQRGYGIILENKDLKEIIEKINWQDKGFFSTNNAINLRTSIIVKAIEESKI